MEKWIRRIDESVALARAREMHATLSTESDDDPNVDADLTRVRLLNEYVLLLLEAADPVLAPQGVLEQISSQMESAWSAVSSFGGARDPSHLGSAMSALEACVQLASGLPSPAPHGESEHVRRMNEAAVSGIARVRSEAEGHLDQLTQRVSDLGARNDQNAAKIDELASQSAAVAAELNEHRASFNSLTTSFQSSFTTEQVERSRTFRAELDSAVAETKAAQTDLVERGDADIAAFKKRSEEQLAGARSIMDEIDRIYEIAGEKALISDYSKRATADSTAADMWRRATVGLGLLAVGVAVLFLFTHDESGDTDWGLIVSKVLTVLAMGGVSAYALNQSNEHRRAQRRNEHMALQLSAVRPYLKDLDDATRDKLLAELASQLFGQPHTDSHPDAIEQLGPGATQLIAVVLGAMKTQGLLKS